MHQLSLQLDTPTLHFTPIIAATTALHSLYSGSNSPTAATIAAIYHGIPCCLLPGNPILAAYNAALLQVSVSQSEEHHHYTQEKYYDQ